MHLSELVVFVVPKTIISTCLLISTFAWGGAVSEQMEKLANQLAPPPLGSETEAFRNKLKNRGFYNFVNFNHLLGERLLRSGMGKLVNQLVTSQA